MLQIFLLYREYTIHHLATDMKDPELHYWTSRGKDTAGFYVACDMQLQQVVVGMVAYLRDRDTLEIFRLSTDIKHRKKGVATARIIQVQETASQLQCRTVRAETWSPEAVPSTF